jgi:hypothetical protein
VANGLAAFARRPDLGRFGRGSMSRQRRTDRCQDGEFTKSVIEVDQMQGNDTTFETHFSIAELARQWRLNRETVGQLVQHEPGVVRVRRGLKKQRTHYSVPESVARRLHNKLDDPVCKDNRGGE